MLSEFSYLGVGLKTKTRKSRKIFILQFLFLKLYQICFCVSLSLFLLPEFVIPLFNCYFCDFRGFRDFRVFDLADIDSYTDENTAFLCKRYVFCNYSTSESIHDTWYETIMRKLILENSCSVKLQYSNSSFF